MGEAVIPLQPPTSASLYIVPQSKRPKTRNGRLMFSKVATEWCRVLFCSGCFKLSGNLIRFYLSSLCFAMTRLFVALSSVVICLASAPTQAAAEKAIVVGSPAILLEPHSTSGAVAVDLRNDQAEAETLHLSVSPAQEAGQGAALAIEGQSANSGVFDLTITPRATSRIRITVSGAAADDFDIDLVDGATRIGKIPVRHKAFALHLTDPKATVALREGQPTDIRVTNDDRETHDVAWTLRIEGQDVCQGRTVVAAKSPGLLTCTPTFRWDRLTRIGTAFRPVSFGDASLILEKPGASADEPPFTIAPLALLANYFGSGAQQWINYFVVVLCLIAGGVVSLLLSQIIPNRLTRTNLKERFDELQRTISGLGVHTDSSLRVLLRVERSRLVDLLRSRAAYSPEFTSIAAQCSQGIDRLQRRTVLVQRLEMVLRQIVDAEMTTRVSSTQSAQARASAVRAQEILRNATPTDADFLVAEKSIADAVQPLADAAAADQAFQQAVLARINERKKDLAEWAANNEFLRIKAIVPQPGDLIAAATPESVATTTIALDRAATKLQLMFDYLRHRRGVTKKEKIDLMNLHEVTFLDLLQNSNVASIQEATIVLQQIRDGIYPESLVRPLRNAEARIVVDPSIVYAGTPLQFSVAFFEPAIERAAAARSAYHCKWNFGDGLSEEAWEVTHYYLITAPRATQEEFVATVTFTDEHGKPVTLQDEKTPEEERTKDGMKTPVTLKATVQVRQPRDRRWFGERSVVEFLKLGAALLLAVFGLVAGARDQIAKLDVLPGLIAVFLIGFGADTIKSLLSSKS